ncbi:P-loop NTPase [Erysipelothrix rhusiopathiae]|nr:P-loop NTPase [Erysipelothrix rhusiopathiae]
MELKVLVFAEDSVAQRLFPMLQDDEIRIVGKSNDENKVLDDISKTKPDIVLIYSSHESILQRVCQQIYLLRPKSVPVVLTQEYTSETMQKVMQTGVHYILPMQIDRSTLVQQLKGIHSNESSRLIALENSSTNNWKSKVITVFSSKGGVGRTTVAMNLAVKLAQKKLKVSILDFDLEFGEVATAMRIETKDTLAELLQEQASPNVDTIRKYMAVHPSGVNVLAAPNSPEFADNISVSQVEKIVSSLRSYYDYLIIDTSMGFNNINLSCFDLSSTIIYVTGMDIPTLRRTKKGLSIVTSLAGNEKIKLVVAKEEPGRVKPKDVSRVLEFPLWHTIPYDLKSSIDALNQGKPIAIDSPLSGVAKAYQVMADEIDQSDSPDEQEAGPAGLLAKFLPKPKEKPAKAKKGKRKKGGK